MPEAFFNALRYGDHDTIIQMLDQELSLADARNESGVSSVMISLFHGVARISELLTERKTNVDILEANAIGQLDIVRRLVEVQPELKNEYSTDGYQILGFASFMGHIDIERYSIEHSAPVNTPSRNSQRVPPLISASATCYLEIVKLLISHGASVWARQIIDFTLPIMLPKMD